MRKSTDRSTSTSETPRQKGYAMSKFGNYLKKFDITSTLTDEDIENTLALLQIYSPTVRRTADRIEEMDEECYQ